MTTTPETQDIPRLSPQEVRERMRRQPGRVHLVCAYENEDKCRQFRLDGSISLVDFARQLARVQPDDQLVFYCA